MPGKSLISKGLCGWLILFLSLGLFCKTKENPKDLIQKGDYYLLVQDVDKALYFYNRLAESASAKDAIKYLFKVARIYLYITKEHEKGIKYLDRICYSFPKSQYCKDSIREKVEVYLNHTFEIHKAIQGYQSLLSEFDAKMIDKEEIRFTIGNLYLKVKDYKKAREELSQIKDDRFKDLAQFRIARSYYRQGNIVLAEKALREFIDNFKKSLWLNKANFQIAQILEEKRDLENAISFYEKIPQKTPIYGITISDKIAALENQLDEENNEEMQDKSLDSLLNNSGIVPDEEGVIMGPNEGYKNLDKNKKPKPPTTKEMTIHGLMNNLNVELQPKKGPPQKITKPVVIKKPAPKKIK